MNWDYITGFFDADGSVTAVKNTSRNKTLQISFHNCELNILQNIQSFIYEDIGIKGHISCKKAKKENHRDAYDLKYSYRSAFEVARKLKTIHLKKKHRINIYKLVQEKTKRNGKYSEQEKLEREKLIEKFFDY